MKKILLFILLFIVIVAGGVAAYTSFFLPDVGPSGDLKIQSNAERISRGQYLATHVTVCIDCHSTRDWSRFSGPVIPGTEGKGGEYFGPEAGFPGKFYAKNITPYHLQNWTDGEIFRAITSGVDKDGKALFPVMPYHNYGNMDKEDVYDIIAYIRSLNPIKNDPATRSIDFPMNFILNTIPEKANPVEKPKKTDIVQYGAYVVNAAGCIDCHSPVDKGKIIVDKAFSGGRAFASPVGTVYSANITPDRETGIGNWDQQTFLSLFKQYEDPAKAAQMKSGELNTPMPWTMYAGMDSTDLISIFEYLKTVQPISNRVELLVKHSN